MSLSRRDFMKLFGSSVAALLLTRCGPYTGGGGVSCYTQVAVVPPTDTPLPAGLGGRARARLCWLSFDRLAEATRQGALSGSSEDALGGQLIRDHRQALDELVADGVLKAEVAGLVQEAYEAAVYHVWRSNAPITCYEPMMVDYAPTSASALVQQAEILDEIAAGGQVDPGTLTSVRAALEHELAFYALGEQDLQALYARLLAEAGNKGQPVPSFEQLALDVPPEALAAAAFIINLLSQP